MRGRQGQWRLRSPKGASMLNILDRHSIGQLLRHESVDAWGVAANRPRLPLAPAELPVAISMLMRIDPPSRTACATGRPATTTRSTCASTSRSTTPPPRWPTRCAAHGQAGRRRAGHVQRQGRRRPCSPTRRPPPAPAWAGSARRRCSCRHEFGPAVRLATVFTDLELPTGEPLTEGRCGDCRACVDACPAGCGRDVLWRAGMARDELFDAARLPPPDDALRGRRGRDLRHLHRGLPAHAPQLAGRATTPPHTTAGGIAPFGTAC